MATNDEILKAFDADVLAAGGTVGVVSLTGGRKDYTVTSAAQITDIVNRLGDLGNDWRPMAEGMSDELTFLVEVVTGAGVARFFAESAEAAKAIYAELF